MRNSTLISRIQRTTKIMTLSMLLALGMAIPGMAQDYGQPEGQQEQYQQQEEYQQDPWEQQQADPADFSEEEIKNTANAYVDIIDIREDYQERLADVDDPEAAQQIQMEANEKITEAVEANDIDVETYNEIITAAQTDEALMNDLLGKIDELE